MHALTRNPLALILLIPLLFASISPGAAAPAAPLAPADLLPWADEFDSATLDPRWTVDYEDAAQWSLTDRPGYLRLEADGNLFADPVTLKNLFRTARPSEDFQVTLVLEAAITRTGEGVGLLLYEDPANVVQFYRYFNGNQEMIRIRQISNLEVTDQVQAPAAPGVTHLRLEVEKGFAAAYTSSDGADWAALAEIPLNSLGGSLAFMAYDTNPAAGQLVADVDSISVAPVEAPAQPWQNLGLYGGTPDPRYYGVIFDTATDATYLCLDIGVYGLYRLPYGATAWEPVLTSGGSGGCGAAAMDNAHSWIYRARQNMLFRSQDAGASWKMVYLNEESNPVLIHLPAGAPDRILLALQSDTDGIVQISGDQGQTWQPASFSPTAGTTFSQIANCRIHKMASDPTDADWVFAAVGSRQPQCQYRGIYRSQDGGQTFTRILVDAAAEGVGVSVGPTGIVFAGVDNQSYRSSSHGDDWIPLDGSGGAGISTHPTQPNLIFKYNHRSDDYGDTWEYTGLTQPVIHPDHTDTYLYPAPFDMRISYDAGDTVTRLNAGIEEVTIWRMAIAPGDPQRIFIADGVNIGRTLDGGNTWDHPNLGDVGYGVVIDPVDPDVVYALNWGGLGFHKSTDGGDTWQPYDIPPYPDSEIWENAMILDPANTQVGYMTVASQGPPQHAIWGGVHKTVDGGEHWSLTALQDIPMDALIWGWSSQELYAGAKTTWDDSRQSGVFRSQDGGEHWQHIGLDDLWIRSLAIDPHNPGRIFAGTNEDGIWKTDDYGEHWSQVQAGIWGYDVEVDYNMPSRVWAAVNRGIYQSLDFGETWSALYAYRPSRGIVYTLDVALTLPAHTGGPQAAAWQRSLFIGVNRGLYAVEIDDPEVFLPLMWR